MSEAPQADAKPKVSKASVNYRRADGPRRCGNCDMFYPGSPLIGTCDLVRGVIDTQDVCKEWVRAGMARAIRRGLEMPEKSKGG